MALKFLNDGFFDGKVGIGTNSPSATLQVSGQVLISATAPFLDFVDTNSFTDPNDRFRIRAGGNQGLVQWYDNSANSLLTTMTFEPNGNVIVPNGNVGIGTTSPTSELHVEGADNANLLITRLGVNKVLLGDSGSNNGGDLLLYNSGGTLKTLIRSDANSYFNGGNVGIGTTSPVAKLHTKVGTSGGSPYDNTVGVFAEGASRSIIQLSSTSDAYVMFGDAAVDNQAWLGYNHATNQLSLHTGGTITMDGNVGIGITSPLHKLSIESASATLLKIRNTTNGGGAAIEFNDNAAAATNQNGKITYYHSDSSSQGGGSSYWLTGEDDQTLVLANNGRVVVQKTGSSTEVGYGFYDDVNTGMYRIGADNLGFATGGVNRLNITNALATFSGDLTVNGGDIILGGTGRIQGVDTVSASTDAANKAYVDAAVAGVPIGDITGVTAGTFLTGGGTSGTVTLNADTSKLGHIVNSSNGTVAAGWITVASASSARRQGEVYVTDGESSDHSFIRIDWMRSYADTNFTVLNCGGHSNRIVGVRVLQETSNTTYGPKYLQIKVTTTSNYAVAVVAPGTIPNYTDLLAVTPVLENTKTGYAVTGAQLEDLDDSSVGTHEGLTVGEDLYVNGGGVVLGGTGRIQGVDTVSSGTDAANKTYVDNAVAGVPQGDITGVGAGTGMTGGGTSGTVTLNVIGGDGITANANNIVVDSTVVRTSGTQAISGSKTFSDGLIISGATKNLFIFNTAETQAGVVFGDTQGGAGQRASIKFDSGTETLDFFVNDETAERMSISTSGVLTINGGNISLAGTGRIQGIDTVSATTDAANKAYVDAAVAGVPIGDITGVTAGTGLTGGGTSGTVTLNVAGGDGITANANDIAVDSTVVRTTGTQTVGGNKTFTNNTVIQTTGGGMLTLRDTNSTGDAATPYINFNDSANARQGYVGIGSSGSAKLYLEGLDGVHAQGGQFSTSTSVFVGTDLTVGGGDIILNGTGRIQGIDTVSATTDAANKAYVDAAITPVGNGQIDGRTSGSGLSGSMDATANQSGNTTFTVNSNATTAATANTIAYRNGSADILARLFRSSYANQSTISGGIAFRVNNGSDNYTRFCSSPSAIRSFIGAGTSSATPAILSNGSTPSLNTGISAAEVRSLIGAGTGNGNGTITGSGTSNFIPKWNGSTGLTNSTTLYNGSTGRININNTFAGNPNGGGDPDLFITGANSNSAACIVLMNSDASGSTNQETGRIEFGIKDDNTNGYINTRILSRLKSTPGTGSPGRGQLEFQTSPGGTGDQPSTKMTIDYRGYVGIGTTNPTSQLQVIGGASYQNISIGSSLNDNTAKRAGITFPHYDAQEEQVALINSYIDANISYVSIGGSATAFNATENIRFYTAANTNTLGGTERMRIDDTGNVGINDTTPAEKLQVNGNIRASGYKSSDGSTGITGTFTFVDKASATRSLTIKNGLITAKT